MQTTYNSIQDVFDKSKCKFCNRALELSTNSVHGYYRLSGECLSFVDELSIDETEMFNINLKNGCVSPVDKKFINKKINARFQLVCRAHDYRLTLLASFELIPLIENKATVILEEEDVMLQGEVSSYLIRNTFISDWDAETQILVFDYEKYKPRALFDIDRDGDMFNVLTINVPYICIGSNIRSMIDKIECLLIFA